MKHFRETIEAHLATINRRDISAFADYLHPGYECILILPCGQKQRGNDEIIAFHKDWFADPDWRMDYQIDDLLCDGKMGYALLDVTYHDKDQDGNSYQMNYWLSLLFKKVDDRWILLRDQNTLK